MKTRPVGVELFRAGGRAGDGQTDRHDATNIRVTQFWERA
jgi:hypothetical protein